MRLAYLFLLFTQARALTFPVYSQQLGVENMANLLSKSTPTIKNGSSSRRFETSDTYQYLAGYSIKFIGCHNVQQLNYDTNGNNDISLYTKRLVRFRLVPYDQCERIPGWAKYGDAVSKFVQDARGHAGIFDDYGEYIVDINTFLTSYIGAVQDQNTQLCPKFQEYCSGNCYHLFSDNTSYQSCLRKCFSSKGATNCYQENADTQATSSYAYCSQFNWNNENNDKNNKNNKQKYYLGPRCSIQGGEIEMALFTDNTCTSLLKCSSGSGAQCYTEQTGITLPYTLTNIIENTCIPCTEKYANLAYSMSLSGTSHSPSNFDFGYPRSYCSNLYNMAGKCETHMTQSNVRNACSYIAGVTIGVSDEGVAKARKVKRRVGPDLAITFMVIGIVFASIYLLYLKNLLSKPKLSKSQYGYVVRTGAWV